MSVPTEGPWDYGLYVRRNGTAESVYAVDGALRPTSVKAAMDILQGTADAAYHAVDDLDVTVETLASGSRGSGEFIGDMPNKTLRLRLPRGEQGPGVGETVASIASGRGFWPLRKALATGTARMVAMGDSKTEGTSLASVDQRWLNQLQDTLRARYAPGGDQGLGYLPAYYATAFGFPTDPTTTGSAATVGNSGGLGNRSRHLAAGGSVTWAVPAWTSGVPLLVHWTQHPGHGDLEVVTGGTVRATIATGGASIESKMSSVTVPAGAASITVRHKAGTGTGNAARVEGIVHRTATDGVIVYDAARSGARLDVYSEGMTQYGAPDSDDRHWQAVALVDPHAIVLAFGANDMDSRTVEQWGHDLEVVVAKAKAASPGAGIIVLHGAQRTGDVVANPGRVLAFEAAARAAVGADPDVTILYESSLWAPTAGVDYTVADPSGWLVNGDTVHTSPAAHAQIARYLAAQITGADSATNAVELAQIAIQPALTAAQAAEASASSAATDAATAIRDNLADDINTPGTPAYEAISDVAGSIAEPAINTVVGRLLVDATAHGVVGDGATNNSAALNALMASVSAAGGGVIVLPIGTYLATAINGASNVTLRGASRDGVILRKTASNSTWIKTGASLGFTVEHLTLDGADLVTSYGVEFSTGSTDCAVRSCTLTNFTQAVETRTGSTRPVIEGNIITAVGTAVRLNQDPVGAIVRRNVITDWTESAIYSLGSATQASKDSLIEGNVVQRHRAGSTGIRQAIRFSGHDANHHQRPVIRGNVVTGSFTNHQDTLDPGSADLISLHRCTGFEVSGNHVSGGGDVGITIAQGCRDGRVIGNVAELNDTVGLCLGSADSDVWVKLITVTGNTFRNNAQDHADTGGQPITEAVTRAKSGVLIVRAQDCVVDGNVVVFDAGHPSAVRNAIAVRECANVHIGEIGYGNKSTGHTQGIYTETPTSTGMTTNVGTSLGASPGSELGRITVGGTPIIVGSVEPEGVIDAPRGAMYLRTAGAAGEQIYYKNAAGATGWRTSSLPAVQTSANLGSVTHAINTAGKYPGRPVFDTTSGKPLWAANGNANGVWRDAAGTATITPT